MKDDDFLVYGCRYVAQGKKILQPHQLLDGLVEVVGENDERQNLHVGLFGDVLRSTQV